MRLAHRRTPKNRKVLINKFRFPTGRQQLKRTRNENDENDNELLPYDSDKDVVGYLMPNGHTGNLYFVVAVKENHQQQQC